MTKQLDNLPREHADISQGAPIESLPNELLEAIFKAGEELCRYSSFQLPFPFLVSSVNRHWRAVALAYPNLWSTIDISFQAPLEFTRLCFERSHSCPIDMTIDIRRQEYSYFNLAVNSNKLGQFRNMMSSPVKRLGRLTISISDKVHLWFILFLMTSSIPTRLYHLCLRSGDKQGVIGLSLSRRFSLHLVTSSLCSLECDGALLNFAPFPALPNLTRFNLKPKTHLPTPQQFKHLLSLSPNLTHLILSGSGMNLDPDPNLETIHAPSLRFLAFNSFRHGRPTCHCFIPSLSMPQLEYMEIKGIGFLSAEFEKHFYKNVTQFVNVRTLRLEGFTSAIALVDSETLSTRFPMVTNLILNGVVGFTHLLRKLATSIKRHPHDPSFSALLWPHLRVVTFLDSSGWEPLPLSIALADRAEAGIPLDTVRLSRELGTDQQLSLVEAKVKVEFVDPHREPGFAELDDSDRDRVFLPFEVALRNDVGCA